MTCKASIDSPCSTVYRIQVLMMIPATVGGLGEEMQRGMGALR